MPKNRSIEPNSARWIITGRCLLPSVASGAGSFATRRRASGSCRTSRSCSRPTRRCCTVYAEAARAFDDDSYRRDRSRPRDRTSGKPDRRRRRISRQRVGHRRLRRHERRGKRRTAGRVEDAGDADLGRKRSNNSSVSCSRRIGPARVSPTATMVGPRVPGLLTDYVSMIHAILDAHEAVESEPYTMMAEELAHHVLRTMWDERSGACVDRAHEAGEVGLLRDRARRSSPTARPSVRSRGWPASPRKGSSPAGRKRRPAPWPRLPPGRDLSPRTTCSRCVSCRSGPETAFCLMGRHESAVSSASVRVSPRP